jgi:hypothetical protein
VLVRLRSLVRVGLAVERCVSKNVLVKFGKGEMCLSVLLCAYLAMNVWIGFVKW